MTVVIPCRNRHEPLRRALDSVLAQTWSDYEVVVVDDASDTPLETRLGEGADPRVRFLRLNRPHGAPAARNEGIRTARGVWIAFLDSDDVWAPLRLERQMERFGRPGAEAISVGYCLLQEQHGEGVPPHRPYDELAEGDVLDTILRGRKPSTSTYMIRRDALEKIGGFDTALPSAQDTDLLLRLAEAGHRFVVVNEVLVTWHQHPDGQISHDAGARWKAYRMLDRRWGPVLSRRMGPQEHLRWRVRRLNQMNTLLRDPSCRSAFGLREVVLLARVNLERAEVRARLAWEKRFGNAV